MNATHAKINNDCRNVQALLSEYIDNTLSARRVWDVEKHLAECAECTEQLRLLQATVQVLQAAPRYDTGKDFMAALHARLDGLEPEPMRARSLSGALRAWLVGLGAILQQNRLPALSAGLAAVILVALLVVYRPAPPLSEVGPIHRP